MFTSQKFCAHRGPAASQSRISGSKIDKSRFGISQNKTGAVIRESLRKIEAPFLKLIKFRARPESTQSEHRRHIKRTTKRLPQANRSQIMMVVILWIVMGVFIADCVGCIREQTGRCEEFLIDRVQIDERFQRRSTTSRLRGPIDL